MKREYLKQESLKWFEGLNQTFKDTIMIMLNEFNVNVEDGIFFKDVNDNNIDSMLKFKLFNGIKDTEIESVTYSTINICTVWESDLFVSFPLNINESDINSIGI